MGLIRRASPERPRPQGRFRILASRRSLTASAVSVGVQDRRDQAAANQGHTKNTSRIERALQMYDREGTCWYPAQFYSRSMERIRYFPAILNENGEPEESEDPQLVELFSQIRDPGGTSMRNLSSSYGRLRFLIGDGRLMISEDPDTKAEQWEYLSPLELRKLRGETPTKYERNDGIEKRTYTEAGEFDKIGGNLARVFRLYRRHPAHSGWSDAPVLSILDLYDTLISLTLATSAEAVSRAALRGLLYIPDEVTMSADGDDEDGVDEDPESDSFLREWIEGMQAAISDPGSAAAASPFIMRGPGLLTTDDGTGRAIATAEALKWMALGPQDRYLESDAADKIIDRIALGLDMPKEMVTGTGQANHWGGWLLDEQGFRQHVAPVVEEFCDDLASVYLRPAAMTAGIADAENVVIWYDPVDAVAHPDEFANAKEAWDRGAISSETVRKAGGFGDDDVPTEEDRLLLLALKGRALQNLDPNAAQGAEGETSPQDGGTGADTKEQPPAQDDSTNGSKSSTVASMILGAAEIQVKAAHKTAGSRIRNRSKSCGECVKKIDGLPAAAVASALGREQVRALIDGRTSEAALVAGAGAMLAGQAREWGLELDAANVLGGMVEAHALRTLYEKHPAPLPAGFAAAVERAVA